MCAVREDSGTFHWLMFEPLEPRLLLSADASLSLVEYGIAPLAVSPMWFEAVCPTAPLVAGDESGLPAKQESEQIEWDGQALSVLPDRWIVQFHPGSLGGITSVADTADVFAETEVGFEVIGGLGMTGQVLIEIPGADIDTVCAWLGSDPGIAYFEPDAVQAVQLLPDDSSFSSLWGMHNTGQTGGTSDADIDAPEAWDITTGSSDVVVAVIDTGIDYEHPDLAANVWVNPGETPDDGIDNDGNGYIDDVHGWDFAYDDSDPMDGDGHGTHVSGTIGAVGDNAKGVAGVNWTVRLMALKFLNDHGSGSTADAILATNYATMMKLDYGVNIVATNNSWGGGGYSSALRDAIQAGGDAGILFVAAAGNGGNDGIGDDNDVSPHYPSNYDLDCIISVAATNHNDQRAGFSNYGESSVDLAAPGVSIYSTLPGSNYGEGDGTSMASPHVAGAVGLLAASDPAATAPAIRSAILTGVDPVASMAGISVTGGRLNVYQAMQILNTPGPRVVDISPSAQSPPVDVIDIRFTEDILPGSVVGGNFQLRDNGPDDAFGSTDDHVFTFTDSDLSRPQANRVQIGLGGLLGLEQYRLTILGTGANPVRNTDGEALNGGEDEVYFFDVVTAWGPLESNDELAEATDTGLSGPGTASFSAHIGDGYYGSRDVDLFALQAGAGATIIADIDAAELGTGLDPILRLFDAGGSELAFDDDTHGQDSYIEYSGALGGAYYVGVSGYDNFSYDPNTPNSGTAASVGDYYLHLTVSGGGGSGDLILSGDELILGINADGSLVASNPSLVGARLLGNEFLTPGTPQASFTLAADGTNYQNNSPADDSPEIVMVLTDLSAGGQLHAQAAGQAGGVSIDRHIFFDAPDRYAVVEVTLTNTTGGAVSGIAWLENLDPDQAFPFDGSFSTSNDVVYGGGYADAAAFLAAFPDGLTIGIGSADPRAVASTEGIDVRDPFAVIDSPLDGEGVAGDVAINLAFDVGSLGAGASTTLTYYLVFDTSRADARDAFESLIGGGGDPFEPNDSLATATPTGLTSDEAATLGTAVFAAFLGDGAAGALDVDLYSFVGETGDTITADIDASQAGSSLDPILRLFDSGGSLLAVNDDTHGLDSFIQYVLPSADDYYVGVSGYNNIAYDPNVPASGVAGSTGDYDLTLTLDAGAPSSGQIRGAKWEDVDGDGARDAGEPGIADWTIYLDLNNDGLLTPQAVDTVDSTDVPKSIRSRKTVTSNLTVAGIAEAIADVNVTLDITHTWDDDVDVFLISPLGTRVELFTDVGGGGDDFQNTVLDDEAIMPIGTGTAPFSGSYRPEGLLADFDGEDPDGTWVLEVTDDAAVDNGTLNSWSLTITTGEPGVVTASNGEYAFTDLPPGTYTVAEVVQAGWRQTFPASGTHTVSVAAGDVIGDKDFGNHFVVPPSVVGVLGSSTSWDASFLAALGGEGYSIPTGADQLATLPWVNIDQVKIVFSEDVTVAQGDLSIHGVNVADYAIAGFSYNGGSHMATWTLSGPVAADKLLLALSDDVTDIAGNALDGEWSDGTSTFPSGDGSEGGDFAFRVNVLPGDPDQSGQVRNADVIKVRLRGGTAPGDADYSVFHDVDGSGQIRNADVLKTRSRGGTALPAGEPEGPAGTAQATSGGNFEAVVAARALPAPATDLKVPAAGDSRADPPAPPEAAFAAWVSSPGRTKHTAGPAAGGFAGSGRRAILEQALADAEAATDQPDTADDWVDILAAPELNPLVGV